MKLKALVFGCLLSVFSTSAFAYHWFPGVVQYRVLPGQVAFTVFNPHFQPIICSGQVFGQTIAGPVFNAFFVEQFMPAGSHRFAFVNATPFMPFSHGWANIHCRFAWF
jgi:hypothetical protein